MSALLLATLMAVALHQQPAPDPRTATQANAQSEQIRRAEDLLEHGDYKAAEPALAALAKANPTDAHILFDLGFTQERNNAEEAAARSYTAAIAADSSLAEPRIALGLLRARAGDTVGAHAQLEAASKLSSASPALRARALRALARLDERTDRDKAREDLLQAIQLTGEQPGDAEITATLATQSGDPAVAEAAFRRSLAESPGDVNATLGLVALLQRQAKSAEADALISPALTAHPDDPQIVAQAVAVYAAEGKSAEAVALVEKLRASDPQAAAQPALTRLLAHLQLVSGNPGQAETLYRQLLGTEGNDPRLLDDLGSALVREQKFADAQPVLAKAVSLRGAFHDDDAWAEAAGHLAFAASRNHQPEVTLQALQARATVLPNSAASLFLQATALDTLHQRKEAERTYRAFLAMAGGKLPDEEFQARHRLIALEHEH